MAALIVGLARSMKGGAAGSTAYLEEAGVSGDEAGSFAERELEIVDPLPVV